MELFKFNIEKIEIILNKISEVLIFFPPIKLSVMFKCLKRNLIKGIPLENYILGNKIIHS